MQRPSDSKISWDELCQQTGPPNRKSHTSQHVLEAQMKKYRGNVSNLPQKIIKTLRPEDAVHIPMFRIQKGVIVDWNRSMCDLTGISRAQVVNKTFADALNSHLPHLSMGYKESSVEWLSKEHSPSKCEEGEECREDYLFPLPLPLSYYDAKFKYAKKEMYQDEFVELFVSRVEDLIKVYPKMNCYPGVPQYQFHNDGFGWVFDTSGWFGGVEFTLKRKRFIPAATNQGAAASEEQEHSDGKVQAESEDVYETIANFIRSCNKIGIEYILEVICNVRRNTANCGKTKKFIFSRDWSTYPETSTMNKVIISALGGSTLITETVSKGEMSWSIANALMKKGSMSKEEKVRIDLEKHRVQSRWERFLEYMAPILGENEHYNALATISPDKTVLTLKIDGYDRSIGGYQEEKFKATATVQVPATLNFFQLHRVVMQAMNCAAFTKRDTHMWLVPQMGHDFTGILENHSSFIQLGDVYFVENGEKADYGDDLSTLFDQGAALRQRVSTTGAYCDIFTPLSMDEEGRGGRNIKNILRGLETTYACIHSTCIDAVFAHLGNTAMLQDGLVKYLIRYKVTCIKREEYNGPLPQNFELNVMQPKVLRGKPAAEDAHWSVARANEQLERDRGCLRRKLVGGKTSNVINQLPWCQGTSFPKRRVFSESGYVFGEEGQDYPHPLAVVMTGIDCHPMFLDGEPPLPGSDEYKSYVASLNGRIDPQFLQEHVIHVFGGFSVPFKPSCLRRRRSYSYDGVDDNNKEDEGIGEIWTREVDEEIQRIEALKPATNSAKGKKRKAADGAATN